MSAAVGEVIFWVAVVSSVVAELAILRAIFRVQPDGATVPRPRRGTEILWAILPALALALVLALTWRAMHPAHAPPDLRAEPYAAERGDPR